jgi:hypothetical protein
LTRDGPCSESTSPTSGTTALKGANSHDHRN